MKCDGFFSAMPIIPSKSHRDYLKQCRLSRPMMDLVAFKRIHLIPLPNGNPNFNSRIFAFVTFYEYTTGYGEATK